LPFPPDTASLPRIPVPQGPFSRVSMPPINLKPRALQLAGARARPQSFPVLNSSAGSMYLRL
jgi:hypothetical protein